jgi:hypothetical protein
MVNKSPDVAEEHAEKRREFLVYLASVPRVTREIGLDDEDEQPEGFEELEHELSDGYYE